MIAASKTGASPAKHGGAALLALVGASLPMNLDPAILNIAVVAAGNALHMTGVERSLAASIGPVRMANWPTGKPGMLCMP